MFEILIASVFAGVVVGAPVGVAGAMVADSALSHTGKRVAATIIAAVSGDLTLAFLTSFASERISAVCMRHQCVSLQVAGGLVILMGIFLLLKVITEAKRRHDPAIDHSRPHWLFSHAAPVLAIYLLALLHPGNVATFLAIVAVFSIRFPDFQSFRLLFVIGIALGSGIIFCTVAFLFWKIKQVADKFLYHFKYALALVVVLTGCFLLIKGVYSAF